MAKADGGVVFERVTKRYGNVTAVDEVSFEVAQGELVTLLGPIRVRQDDHAADGGRARSGEPAAAC
jgi:hypothetical protein